MASELANDRNSDSWIVLLNGTSCSVKTTLSRALQHSLSVPRRPFLHIEAHRFVPEFADDAGDGSLAIPMHRAIPRAIASFADQVSNLVVDGALPYGHSDSVNNALCVFRRHRLCYVGVHCDLDVLEQPERGRADRINGYARRQYQDIHLGATYDIEVDTTTTGADKNTNWIARYLNLRDAKLVGTQ